MKTRLQSTVESGVVALLAAACCLWFLISAATEAEPHVPLVVLLSLALAGSLAAHWVFMGLVVQLTGRSLWAWLPFLVVFVPVGTAVLLALLAAGEKEISQTLPPSRPEGS